MPLRRTRTAVPPSNQPVVQLRLTFRNQFVGLAIQYHHNLAVLVYLDSRDPDARSGHASDRPGHVSLFEFQRTTRHDSFTLSPLDSCFPCPGAGRVAIFAFGSNRYSSENPA